MASIRVTIVIRDKREYIQVGKRKKGKNDNRRRNASPRKSTVESTM